MFLGGNCNSCGTNHLCTECHETMYDNKIWIGTGDAGFPTEKDYWEDTPGNKKSLPLECEMVESSQLDSILILKPTPDNLISLN